MACRGTGVPVVISVRIDPRTDYVGLRNTLLIRRYMGRAAGAVFQTEDAKSFFSEELQKKSVVILNPITPKYIEAPAPDHREKVIVNAARLVQFKNQKMLVRAFAKVHRLHPDYILRIYGADGGEGVLQELEQIIQDEGLEKAAFLMGQSDTLEKDLLSAAVFAYSSDYEGMPNSLMEAMALGLPCVSTDCPCGGPRELIQEGVNGMLVPVGDTDMLAEKICYMIEHPKEAEQMGRKASEISEKASLDAVYMQWKNYLEQVAAVKI
jgi:glycosyltransferase involved in cell wall biosynthesis